MKNKDKQNANYLGELSQEDVFEIIKRAASLPDSAMGSEKDFKIRETARRHVRDHEAEIRYFMATENGIADIDIPLSDN